MNINKSTTTVCDLESETIEKLKHLGPGVSTLIGGMAAPEGAGGWCQVYSIKQNKYVALPVFRTISGEYWLRNGSEDVGYIKIAKQTDVFVIRYIENLSPENFQYVGTTLMQMAFGICIKMGCSGKLTGQAQAANIAFFCKCGATSGTYKQKDQETECVPFIFSPHAMKTKRETEDYKHWVSWIE